MGKTCNKKVEIYSFQIKIITDYFFNLFLKNYTSLPLQVHFSGCLDLICVIVLFDCDTKKYILTQIQKGGFFVSASFILGKHCIT